MFQNMLVLTFCQIYCIAKGDCTKYLALIGMVCLEPCQTAKMKHLGRKVIPFNYFC